MIRSDFLPYRGENPNWKRFSVNDTSWLGDATSPVVVRYRVLGITMSQTLSIGEPILVMQPYRACL
jgi:hypothetical protein